MVFTVSISTKSMVEEWESKRKIGCNQNKVLINQRNKWQNYMSMEKDHHDNLRIKWLLKHLWKACTEDGRVKPKISNKCCICQSKGKVQYPELATQEQHNSTKGQLIGRTWGKGRRGLLNTVCLCVSCPQPEKATCPSRSGPITVQREQRTGLVQKNYHDGLAQVWTLVSQSSQQGHRH